jgi:hypothetical protein
MKIAQISPLMESVPPRLYGGTERIVSYLTDELVARALKYLDLKSWLRSFRVCVWMTAHAKPGSRAVRAAGRGARLRLRKIEPQLIF